MGKNQLSEPPPCSARDHVLSPAQITAKLTPNFAKSAHRHVPQLTTEAAGSGGGGDVAPGSTTVEITLTRDGDGTLLRLRHGDLPIEVQRASHPRAGHGTREGLPLSSASRRSFTRL